MIDFKKIIDEMLLKESSKERVRSGKFSPSKLGRCFRHQVLNRLDIPKSNPPDERTLRVFEAGKLFEKFALDWASVPEDKRQIKVESKDFSGYIDAIGENEIYEIKSQHSNGFHYMMKDGYDINEGKKHNILQAIYYAYAYDKEKAIIVWVSKDDLCIYQHPFFVKDWKDVIIAEIDTLMTAWEEKVLPSATPRCFKDSKTGKYKECSNYCEWRDYCKGLDQNAIPFSDMDTL